jgi:hypothetical protein
MLPISITIKMAKRIVSLPNPIHCLPLKIIIVTS